jgi:hypothetical protein
MDRRYNGSMPEPSEPLSETPPPPQARETFGPDCIKCGSTLRLVLVEPTEPKYEKRMYRCDKCGHLETRTLKLR